MVVEHDKARRNAAPDVLRDEFPNVPVEGGRSGLELRSIVIRIQRGNNQLADAHSLRSN
jgi:hypothetical protein